MKCKRRGLKITLSAGSKKGEGLMRRLDVGPDPVVMLDAALQEAARAAGVELTVEDGAIFIELSETRAFFFPYSRPDLHDRLPRPDHLVLLFQHEPDAKLRRPGGDACRARHVVGDGAERMFHDEPALDLHSSRLRTGSQSALLSDFVSSPHSHSTDAQ